MHWMNHIVNEYPKNMIFVYIQNGKAMYRTNINAFAEIDKALAFQTKEQAEFFIANYSAGKIDYRDSMLKDDYVFYVFHKMDNDKYYADDLRMSKDYEPIKFPWSK